MAKEFKALETPYHGYRFRSRLEARWAVFFDQLGIHYRYEPEGYLLEGRGYVPDFFLPQQNCFIEIKPKQPLPEELEKARLLTLATGKAVYILYGDVWFAEKPIYRQACGYTTPKIYAFSETNQQGEALGQEIEGFEEVKVLLQKLDEIGLTVRVEANFISLASTYNFEREAFRGKEYVGALQKQYEQVLKLSPQLQQAHDALIEAFTEKAGWRREFMRQQLSWDFEWAECTACGDLALRNEREEDGEAAFLHERCPRSALGRYSASTKRLKVAYQKARQERFTT